MPFITQTSVVKGDSASVEVGEVVTGEPNSEAQVINTGTPQNVVLKFVIPKGADGYFFANVDGGDANAVYGPIEPLDPGGA